MGVLSPPSGIFLRDMIKIVHVVILLGLSFTSAKAANPKTTIHTQLQTACQTLNNSYRQAKNIPAEKVVSIAVVNFTVTGKRAKEQDLGSGIAGVVSSRLAKVQGVKAIDRKRMKSILEELKLSQSGLVAEGNAKQVGRILAADLLLGGSVAEMGSDFVVSLKLTDVETAEIVAGTDVKMPVKDIVPMAAAANLERKHAITAAFRSLSMPGWGHFYNYQPGWGYLYTGTEVALVLASLAGTMLADIAYDDYMAINLENYDIYYPDASSVTDAVTWAFDDARNAASLRNTLWYVTGGVWALNAIHAWINASLINSKINKYAAEEQTTGKDIRLVVLPYKNNIKTQLQYRF